MLVRSSSMISALYFFKCIFSFFLKIRFFVNLLVGFVKQNHFFWIQNSHLFPYSYHLFAIVPTYLFVAYKGLLVC